MSNTPKKSVANLCAAYPLDGGCEVAKRCEALEAENARLRFGLETILHAEGSPDPAGGLQTVMSITRMALAGGRNKNENDKAE